MKKFTLALAGALTLFAGVALADITITNTHDCPRCNGTGEICIKKQNVLEPDKPFVECRPCTNCNGTGKVTTQRSVER